MSRIRNTTIAGGIAGVASTLCYISVIAIPMNEAATFFVAMLWPILSIVSLFSMYKLIDAETPSAWNELALIMGCIAFSLVAAMLSVQLAVGTGIEEYASKASATDQETLKLIRRAVRLVDLGLDVAWDMFIGTALLFLFGALRPSRHFGPGWAIPSGLFGLALIILNVITFPWPPDTRGLFDVGPFIGLFIIALATRMFIVGRRLPNQ